MNNRDELTALVERAEILKKNLETIPFAHRTEYFHLEVEKKFLELVAALKSCLARVDELEQEVALDDHRIEQILKVIHAIPECKAHGNECLPHAIEWVEKAAEADQGQPEKGS